MGRELTVLRGGDVVTSADVIPGGEVLIENGKIAGVGAAGSVSARAGATVLELPAGAMVLPGFIDLHMHGLGSYFTRGEEIKGVARLEPAYGTTSFLPTLANVSYDEYLGFLGDVKQAMESAVGARILGAHLEGPYVNPVAKGGMVEEFITRPEPKQYGELIEKGGKVLRLMTVSPEVPGVIELIGALRRNGTVVSAGHSTADEGQMRRTMDAGLSHICHLFNACRKISDSESGIREPGFPEMCLALDGLTAEIICDGVHVHPLMVRLAVRALGVENVVAITDSVRGTGLPDGVYPMADGREFYTRDGDAARLVADNTIVGSTLTMNVALRNLVEMCGVSLTDASRITSLNAARVMGCEDSLGSIEPGKSADIAVLDPEFRCLMTLIEGKIVY